MTKEKSVRFSDAQKSSPSSHLGSKTPPRTGSAGARRAARKKNQPKAPPPKPLPKAIVEKYIRTPVQTPNYNPDTEAEPLVDQYKHIDEVKGIIYAPVKEPESTITVIHSPPTEECLEPDPRQDSVQPGVSNISEADSNPSSDLRRDLEQSVSSPDSSFPSRPCSAPVSPHRFQDRDSGQYFRLSQPETSALSDVEVRVYDLQRNGGHPPRVNNFFPQSTTEPNPQIDNKLELPPQTTDDTFGTIDERIQRAEDFVTELNNELHGMTTVGPQRPAVYTVNPSANPRLEEKASLQIINDRLGHYVKQVRSLRDEAAKQNSSALMESLNILDDEMKQLKDMYENELCKSRDQNEGLSEQKNKYAQQVSHVQSHASDLENRLLQETDRSTKKEQEVVSLRRTIDAKDKEITTAHRAMDGPLYELKKLQHNYNDKLRDEQHLTHRFDTVQLQLQESESRNYQLQQKLDFQIKLNNKDSTQMNDRLQVATNTIINLEAKIRELSQLDHNLETMLSEVKARAEADLRMYQQESTELYNRNLTAMKSQLDEDIRKIDDLSAENVALNTQLNDINVTCRGLEGEIKSLYHQKQSLQDSMLGEQNHSRQQISILQNKLRDLMDLLMMKMREVSVVRDAQLPLKSEIESLKRQLDEEERRMALPILAATSSAVTQPPPMPTYSAPPVPSALIDRNPVKAEQQADTISQMSSVGDEFHGLDNEFLALDHHRRVMPSTAPCGPVGPIYGEKPFTGHLVGPLASGAQREGKTGCKPGTPTRENRVKSAPAATGRPSKLVSANIGQGDDYFEKLFHDLKRTNPYLPHNAGDQADDQFSVPLSNGSTPRTVCSLERPASPGPTAQTPAVVTDRPHTSASHDYTTCSSSAIGDVKVNEIHPEGKYIRIVNTHRTKDMEFGDFLLQQNVGGQPVAVFRFPPRLVFAANSVITVYSGENDALLHEPPRSFVFTEQLKWGTGPECTTILCKPSGQAIAWRTAAHRFTQDAYDNVSRNMAASPTCEAQINGEGQDMKEEVLTELNADVTGLKGNTPCLKREKASRPCLSAQKHPHGLVPPNQSHPHTGQGRPKVYGNDNSSVNRQSRSQSAKPDPIPGAPYAGAPAQRMGSALLMSYTPNKNTVRGNGTIANKSSGAIRYGPPSPFLSPLQQEFMRSNDSRMTAVLRY